MTDTRNESGDGKAQTLGRDPQTAVVLVVDGRPGRGDALAADLAALDCGVRVATDLTRALELLARTQPDVVVIETAQLEASGAILPERMAALVPWATLIACGRLAAPSARRALVRRFELHGVHPDDGDADALCELVQSALASAHRARRVLSESELRELIVAKLCHEIRTCLYVVEGYAEILCAAPEAKGRSEAAERIGTTSHFALGLVQDYLDLATEPRPTVAARAPVDLEEVVEDLRREAQRRATGRPLRVAVDGATRGATLEVDGDKLRCILGHLMASAGERTRRGEVRLEIRMGATATDFVVGSDEPALLDETWIAPRRDGEAHGEPSLAGVHGQGLGLAIAFRMSRMLGAALDVDLAAPRGARFRLRVPVRARSKAVSDAQGEASMRPILH